MPAPCMGVFLLALPIPAPADFCGRTGGFNLAFALNSVLCNQWFPGPLNLCRLRITCSRRALPLPTTWLTEGTHHG